MAARDPETSSDNEDSSLEDEAISYLRELELREKEKKAARERYNPLLCIHAFTKFRCNNQYI